MATPIIKHEIEPHPDDDPSHPIPHPGVIDVVGYRKFGGARLSIIVASPLLGDAQSQTRLRDKIEAYLAHISSAAFQAKAGLPTPANTTIAVVLHPGSAPEIYDLLRHSEERVRSNNASLVVEALPAIAH
jgi:hypothetical protein